MDNRKLRRECLRYVEQEGERRRERGTGGREREEEGQRERKGGREEREGGREAREGEPLVLTVLDVLHLQMQAGYEDAHGLRSLPIQ